MLVEKIRNGYFMRAKTNPLDLEVNVVKNDQDIND